MFVSRFCIFGDWIHLLQFPSFLHTRQSLLHACFPMRQGSFLTRGDYSKMKDFYSQGKKTIKDSITKTCLYNFDPLKPHFYTVNLGFTGVYIIFLFSAQNIDCGYSLEPHRRGGSNEYQQSMFWAEIWKISEFFIWKFLVFGDEIFYIFE